MVSAHSLHCEPLTYQWDSGSLVANPPSQPVLVVEGGTVAPGTYPISVKVCDVGNVCRVLETFVTVRSADGAVPLPDAAALAGDMTAQQSESDLRDLVAAAAAAGR